MEEKIYVVYGNLNRDNDCDYKVHKAFRNLEEAKKYARDTSVKAMDDQGLVPVEAWLDEKIFEGNVLYGYSTNDWDVEIYVAEVLLK